MGPARRHLSLDEVGSTNAVALEAARSGDPGPLWVTATRQSAGRGRRGRPWVSAAGNLYATLLLVDATAPENLADLPLVAALGVRNGLAALASAADATIAIKWPNDILVNGKKAVGILLESERLRDGRVAAVIGCGVNVGDVPADMPYAVTGLQREGISAEVSDVFSAVAKGVEQAIGLWDRGGNFASVRVAWLDHVVGLGGACKVRLDGTTMDGLFTGLDERGRLILKGTDGRLRLISAGDLFLAADPEAGESRRTDIGISG